MVSTRTTKVMGSVEAKKDEDVLPMIEAYIKGQRIQKVYVDGGAQVCVMSEKMMNWKFTVRQSSRQRWPIMCQ